MGVAKTTSVKYIRQGEPTTRYWLVASVTSIKIDKNGNLSQSSFTVKAMKQTGEGNPVANPSEASISYVRTASNGTTYNGTVTSGGSVSVPASARQFTFSLSVGGQIVDTLTVSVIVDGEDGGQGGTGNRGPALRGPMDWESCDIGFQFYEGAEGEQYIDVVLYNGRFWVCKDSHSKASNLYPSASSTKWDAFSDIPFVATKILLSEKAQIDEITAGGIIMKDDNGNVVFEAHDGKVLALDGQFRGQVTAGDPNKMHVELDPSTPAMKVYNASGQECTSHTGEVFSSYTSLLPSGSGTGPSYASSVSAIYVDAINSRVMTSQSRNLFTAQFTPSGNGQMSFTVTATFGVTANAGTTVIQAAAAKVIVDIYDSSGNFMGSKVTMLGSMGNSIASKTYTQKVSVNVQSGYKYMARIVVEAQGVNAQATSISTSNRSFLTEFFQSKFFGNGFALSKNTANYLIAMLEGNIMRMRLAGEFYHSGAYSRNGYAQPYVVYIGRAYQSTNTAISSISSLHNPSGASVSLAAVSGVKGCYNVTFPASMGLTPSNCLVEVCGYGRCAGTLQNDRPAQATVIGLTGALVVTVGVSDDGGHQYGGGFQIKVSKFN